LDYEELWAYDDEEGYPNGIPPAIFFHGWDHRRPWGGEVDGILYEQAEGEAARELFELWDRGRWVADHAERARLAAEILSPDPELDREPGDTPTDDGSPSAP
jgi:hypothetical protein